MLPVINNCPLCGKWGPLDRYTNNCASCAEKPMPIVDIPPKIPSIKGAPAIKFGLKYLTVWTEQKEGFKVTQDLQPGFALPVLVLEKVPTPDQVSMVQTVLEGLKPGQTLVIPAGVSALGVAESPGEGSNHYRYLPPPICKAELDALRTVMDDLRPAFDRAQKMMATGHWGKSDENCLTRALDRIESLERDIINHSNASRMRENTIVRDRDEAQAKVDELERAMTRIHDARFELVEPLREVLGQSQRWAPSAVVDTAVTRIKELEHARDLSRADNKLAVAALEEAHTELARLKAADRPRDLTDETRLQNELASVNRQMGELNDALGILDISMVLPLVNSLETQLAAEKEKNLFLQQRLDRCIDNAHQMADRLRVIDR
jgi:hypothetical protein